MNARAAVLALGLVACSDAAGDAAVDAQVEPTAATSGTLAWVDGQLWVASPDDDAIVAIDPATLAAVRRISVADAPTALAATPAGDLLVVPALGSAITIVTPDAGTTHAVAVPCGGLGAVVGYRAGGRQWALATCPNDGRVVYVDLDASVLVTTLELGGRPSGIAVAGHTAYVTDSAGGRIWPLPAEAPVLDPPASGTAATHPTAGAVYVSLDVAVPPDRTASQLDAIALLDGSPVWAFQAVDNDSDRARPPEAGGYGSVVDGDPRIEPRIGGACAGRYARFDGRDRVFSGPSAIAVHRDLIWVVNAYTSNVAVLRCDTRGGLLELRASFRVGDGARGIVLAADGRTAWVDNAFDHSIARLVLPDDDGAYVAQSATVRRDTEVLRLSTAAQAGRRLFGDALDVQLTPSGIVTCATCHPGGGDDGQRWFLHTATVPRKLRRTPPAWQIDATAVPLHWDAEFEVGTELVRGTVQGLMGGLALGVDADSIVAYMREQPAPPPRPLDADEAARAARGADLFASDALGCATCHPGERGSDGLLHDVVAPSQDADAAMPAVRTPTLTAVRARAPYLHDGRAASLRALFVDHNLGDRHGRTSHLDPDALDALVLYLETR